MKICLFGFFDPSYSRNSIVVKSLLACEAEVVSVQKEKVSLGGIFSLLFSIPKDIDVVLVGYSDNRIGVLLAKIFFRGPVIWDAFYSLYDTRVHDRNLVSKHNLKAWLYWFLDWMNITLADGYVFDTAAHREYFEKTFGAKRNKGKVLYIGSDTEEVSCEERDVIGFYGKYIPLQGVEKIVEAAALLPEYSFEFIGSGQTYKAVQERIKELGVENITCIDRLPYDELMQRVCSWKLALGIFGASEKASRVIPNKIYDAAALGKAIITLDTPAVRELFVHDRDIILVDGSPESVAREIKDLMEDAERRVRIGDSAKMLSKKKLAKKVLGIELISFLRKYVG
ncbi:MAG: glycosyltransferase [Patescibacteria group bacterium UBA2103]